MMTNYKIKNTNIYFTDKELPQMATIHGGNKIQLLPITRAEIIPYNKRTESKYHNALNKQYSRKAKHIGSLGNFYRIGAENDPRTEYLKTIEQE